MIAEDTNHADCLRMEHVHAISTSDTHFYCIKKTHCKIQQQNCLASCAAGFDQGALLEAHLD